MAKRQNTHRLVITVTFNKPCSATHARQEVADCIHGTFYPTERAHDDPGEFRVRSFKPLPKP